MIKTLKNNQIAWKNWHESFFDALNRDFDFFVFSPTTVQQRGRWVNPTTLFLLLQKQSYLCAYFHFEICCEGEMVPIRVHTILISTQHDEGVSHEQIQNVKF